MRLANRLPGLLLAALPLLLRSVGASPMGASAAAVSASAALATIATTARARAAAAAVAVEPSGETADEAELARNEVLASLKTEEAALEAQLAAVQARKKSLLASRRLRIGIVGFGPFGQFLAKTFVINNDVVAASRSDHSARAFELGASAYVSLSDPAALFAQQLDVLLISVSIVSFERTLAALTPYMEGRDVLVVDVLSVKDFPKKLFEERVPASCDILATHPMFGPESGGGPNGWRGLNFVYDAVRIADRPEARDRLERFLSVWEEQGCRMVEMSAGQHDAHAASSQFVTHLTGRLLGNLELAATPIDTKGFQSLLGVVENTIADSWDLFYGLYKFNEANAQHIIAAVRDSLTELVRQLEDTDAKT